MRKVEENVIKIPYVPAIYLHAVSSWFICAWVETISTKEIYSLFLFFFVFYCSIAPTTTAFILSGMDRYIRSGQPFRTLHNVYI